MSEIRTVDILGLGFPIQNYRSTIDRFSTWIAEKKAHQVCIANVHTVVTAQRDAAFFELNAQADMLTMDGQPLRWYANLVHKAGVEERVCGPELMLRCLDEGQQHGWKHYFLGGRDEVLATLEANLRQRFPQAQIVGAYSPPFRELSAEEDQAIVDQINAVEPDFLWVGLGAPKQERWIREHINRVQAPVQLGVGAAFDFHAGAIKRAPEWMQKSGLEWCYRAFHDKRLWSRYLSTNPTFLYCLLRDVLKSKFTGQQPAKRLES